MADTLKTFTVECPGCLEEFEADIPEAALLPDAEPFSIECPECFFESEIVYDAATQALTLEDACIVDDEDEDDLDTPLVDDDDNGEDDAD